MSNQPKTTKKTITHAEYLQLLGLRLIADRHQSAMDELSKAAAAITGETDELGHTYDYVWSNRELDEMLDVLELKVELPATGKPT